MIENVPNPLAQKLERWDVQGESLEAVACVGAQQEEAQVFRQQWSPRKRVMRAVRTLVIWWGVAALAIGIPILHFVLVPLFLLVGIIAAPIAYGRTSCILGGVGRCPVCHNPFEIVGGAERWPVQEICESCRRHVRVERNGDAQHAA